MSFLIRHTLQRRCLGAARPLRDPRHRPPRRHNPCKPVPTSTENGTSPTPKDRSATSTPPDTRDVIAEFPMATAADTERAIDAAAEAFQGWRKTPGPERGRAIWRAADIARRRVDEIAEMMTREEGKIFKEARGEVLKGISLMEYNAGAGYRLGGKTLPVRGPGHLHLHHPPAHGRRGAHRAVELPLGDTGVEVGAGAGGGQRGAAQAGVPDPVHGGPPGGGLRGSRHSQGRLQRGGGLRRRRGGDHRQLPAHPGGVVHRLQRDRQRPLRQGGLPWRQGDMRDGRQERGHRHARLRPRQGGGGDTGRRLRLHRPALHRHLPGHRHRRHPERAGGPAGGARQ